MTTKNIEWLIGRLRAFSGTSLAPALMHQAADTLQSQAERVKALELDLDVQAGSIEAVQAVNTRQAERITELEAESLNSDVRLATVIEQREKLRAQLAVIAATEPVLVVEKEPDYWSGGHFHEGSKSHIGSTKVWRLPIGTKLFTHPVPAEIAATEPVAWAISYDGVTPYTLWHEGDGPLLDCEVKRQGGTTQKMPLFARPMPPIIGLQDVHAAITADPTLAESNAEFDESQFKSVEDLIAHLNKLNSYRDRTLEALSKYKGAK